MKNYDRTSKEKLEFKRLTRDQVRGVLEEIGEPAYREEQLFRWVCRGVEDFASMSDLPGSLRAELEARFSFASLHVMREQISRQDGTRKLLLSLPDGHSVETVFLPYAHGNSLCVSTQVGCSMGCTFCASGIGGKERNLDAWEMLYQVTATQNHVGKRISHVVLMGMGEPFDNYEEVAAFLRTVHDPKGLGMSYRNMTVSTCGVVPGIEAFARDFPQSNLAISLHAVTQEERERMMPVARAYPLGVLLEAVRSYTERTRRRVTFEYALIRGHNDSVREANELAALLSGMLCHVNLIPLNPIEEAAHTGSSRMQATRFADALIAQGIPATIRRSLGCDIDGACGQLRRNVQRQPG